MVSIVGVPNRNLVVMALNVMELGDGVASGIIAEIAYRNVGMLIPWVMDMYVVAGNATGIVKQFAQYCGTIPGAVRSQRLAFVVLVEVYAESRSA